MTCVGPWYGAEEDLQAGCIPTEKGAEKRKEKTSAPAMVQPVHVKRRFPKQPSTLPLHVGSCRSSCQAALHGCLPVRLGSDSHHHVLRSPPPAKAITELPSSATSPGQEHGCPLAQLAANPPPVSGSVCNGKRLF